jgi:hypothetical protein
MHYRLKISEGADLEKRAYQRPLGIWVFLSRYYAQGIFVISPSSTRHAKGKTGKTLFFGCTWNTEHGTIKLPFFQTVPPYSILYHSIL